MANHEHYRWLLPAIASGNCRNWNFWRIDNPELLPSLIAVELGELNLPFIDLSRADLRHSNLSGTNLFHSNLQRADLSRANLRNAYLREADLSGAYLRDTNLTNADLRDANLTGADLTGARLAGVDMTGANLKNIKLGNRSTVAEAQFGEGVSLLERAALCLTKFKLHEKTKRPAAAKCPADVEKRH